MWAIIGRAADRGLTWLWVAACVVLTAAIVTAVS